MENIKRTIKEQEFLEAYIKNKGNATKAYIEVSPGVKIESAAVLGCNLLRKINISMPELLDKMGMDDAFLSEKLREGLTATTGTGKDKKPNYYVVAKYLDMIHRLKAKYPIDETRLKLPGIQDGAVSVTLKEIIYSKDGKKKIKESVSVAKNEEDTPF